MFSVYKMLSVSVNVEVSLFKQLINVYRSPTAEQRRCDKPTQTSRDEFNPELLRFITNSVSKV